MEILYDLTQNTPPLGEIPFPEAEIALKTSAKKLAGQIEGLVKKLDISTNIIEPFHVCSDEERLKYAFGIRTIYDSKYYEMITIFHRNGCVELELTYPGCALYFKEVPGAQLVKWNHQMKQYFLAKPDVSIRVLKKLKPAE